MMPSTKSSSPECRVSAPYVESVLTGGSGTRDMVSLFLQNYAVLSSLMFGGVPNLPEPLYIVKAKNAKKRYIGRAGTPSAGINPFEFMWCVRIDIKHAIETVLSPFERRILGEFYLGSSQVNPAHEVHEDEAVYAAKKLGLPVGTVKSIVSRAKTKVAKYLDDTNDPD